MPARDGIAHGEIKRSNRFPNCSYFLNWVNPADTITWDAEVAATGDYQVELYYACPQTDVGSTFELTFNENRLAGKIVEPHDSPLIGEKQDRTPRTESYVKRWNVLNMGVMHLDKGPGTLTLKANDMPGGQVMEFRLLMLTRK